MQRIVLFTLVFFVGVVFAAETPTSQPTSAPATHPATQPAKSPTVKKKPAKKSAANALPADVKRFVDICWAGYVKDYDAREKRAEEFKETALAARKAPIVKGQPEAVMKPGENGRDTYTFKTMEDKVAFVKNMAYQYDNSTQINKKLKARTPGLTWIAPLLFWKGQDYTKACSRTYTPEKIVDGRIIAQSVYDGSSTPVYHIVVGIDFKKNHIEVGKPITVSGAWLCSIGEHDGKRCMVMTLIDTKKYHREITAYVKELEAAREKEKLQEAKAAH